MLVGFSHEKIGAAVAAYLARKGRRVSKATRESLDPKVTRESKGFKGFKGRRTPLPPASTMSQASLPQL